MHSLSVGYVKHLDAKPFNPGAPNVMAMGIGMRPMGNLHHQQIPPRPQMVCTDTPVMGCQTRPPLIKAAFDPNNHSITNNLMDPLQLTPCSFQVGSSTLGTLSVVSPC